MREKWKHVKGYEGLYKVSDCGDVKQLAHVLEITNQSPRLVKEKILKISDRGTVNLTKDGESKTLYVRSLVAEAFMRLPYGRDITHLNGDPLDAHVSNLVPTQEFRKMDEDWRDIPGYEGYYQASRFGQIRSLDRYMENTNGVLRFCQGVVKVPYADPTGYYYISLYKDGKERTLHLHRYIAMAWLPNPTNKPTVNHIDGDKHNNCIENLEWATHSEQQVHALQTGLRKKSYWRVEKHGPVGGSWNRDRQVRVRCIEDNKEYESISAAGDAYGLSASEVKRSMDDHCIAGKLHFVKASEPNYSFGVDNLEGETWYDIPGFEGLYQVSNKDRVKSLFRQVSYKDGRTRSVPERVLKCNGTYVLNKHNEVTKMKLPEIKQLVGM